MLFLQSYAIQPAPLNKPCITLRFFLFLSRQVSLAEYIRVLRICPAILQVKFSACWIWWLIAGRLGDVYIVFLSICFYWRMSIKLAMYFNLCYYNLFKAMLSLLIWFELSIVLIICELCCNIISAANSMYVMCICLIYYDLGCDVDLSIQPMVHPLNLGTRFLLGGRGYNTPRC